MPTMNLSDMFTCADLSAAVNKLPYKPSMLRQYFGTSSIRTTSAVIDVESHKLHLVSDSRRGTMGSVAQHGSRKVISLPATHLSLVDAIMPEDVENVRAFGSTEPETIANRIARKQSALRANIEATLEYHRVGAVKGQVLDADGSTVLYDLFTDFGATAQTESITFPTAAGADVVLQKSMAISDKVSDAMGGTPFAGIAAICGATFWEKLVSNPVTREAYNEWYANNANRFGNEPFLRGAFEFGGITYYKYAKSVNGTSLVSANKCYAFPYGDGIFQTIYAPADYVETVNTDGQEFYSRIEERHMGKGYDLEVQSNPITLCMYPEALVEVTGS